MKPASSNEDREVRKDSPKKIESESFPFHLLSIPLQNIGTISSQKQKLANLASSTFNQDADSLICDKTKISISQKSQGFSEALGVDNGEENIPSALIKQEFREKMKSIFCIDSEPEYQTSQFPASNILPSGSGDGQNEFEYSGLELVAHGNPKDSTSQSLRSSIEMMQMRTERSHFDQEPNFSQGLLAPINLDSSRVSDSPEIALHLHRFESDSDTLKDVCISKMNKLHRHKPLSYCFKETVTSNNYMHDPTRSLSSRISPITVVSSRVVGEEIPKKPSRTRFMKPLNVVLVLLATWSICSVYFVVFGTTWSFSNYLNSLPESRKYELAQELNLKYASTDDLTRISRENLISSPSSFLISGVVYNPPSSNHPHCGLLKSKVVRDLLKISTFTTRIRTYGTQCNQARYILEAIHEAEINLSLSLGIWISTDTSLNNEQILVAKSLLQTKYAPLIDSVIVGSDVLQRNEMDENSLVQYINEVKSIVSSHELKIPVGTAESLESVTASLVNSCDIIGMNLQPFLSGISSSHAATWAAERMEETRNLFSESHTKFMIAEIGWPYQGGAYLKARASPDDMQRFMDTWMCKESNSDYYYFEAFDEPWKKMFHTDTNHWETEWGLISYEGQKKPNLLFPTCDS